VYFASGRLFGLIFPLRKSVQEYFSLRSPRPVECSRRLPSCGGFNRVNVSAVNKFLTDTIELLAAVAEFVAGQVQQQGGPALIAVGQLKGLVKIGFFNGLDDGGKVDT